MQMAKKIFITLWMEKLAHTSVTGFFLSNFITHKTLMCMVRVTNFINWLQYKPYFLSIFSSGILLQQNNVFSSLTFIYYNLTGRGGTRVSRWQNHQISVSCWYNEWSFRWQRRASCSILGFFGFNVHTANRTSFVRWQPLINTLNVK